MPLLRVEKTDEIWSLTFCLLLFIKFDKVLQSSMFMGIVFCTKIAADLDFILIWWIEDGCPHNLRPNNSFRLQQESISA